MRVKKNELREEDFEKEIEKRIVRLIKEAEKIGFEEEPPYQMFKNELKSLDQIALDAMNKTFATQTEEI